MPIPSTNTNHDIARAFFAALSRGDLSDDLVTADMTAWTTTGGPSEKAKYQGGVKMLATLFDGGLKYSVVSLTAEEDRIAAEVRSAGKLIDGKDFANSYLFLLRIRDGRIAAVAEHFNPAPVTEWIRPLIMSKMAKK